MKIRNFLFISVSILLLAASLSATSSHTWVSGTGSDSNSGTPASPYATFATAIANTAAGGVISVESPGDFGPITITQSITIDGIPGASITFSGGEGIYVDTAPGATVVLRNLTVDGGGVGADAIFWASSCSASCGTAAPEALVIENCKLEGFTQIGIGVGSESPQNLVVKNTTITGGTLGVRTFQSSPLAAPYDQVELRGVTISNASTAAVFTRDGVLNVSDSVLTQSLVGLEADSSAVINAENNMITFDGTGVLAYTSSTIRLSNNDIFDNGTGIDIAGGTVASAGNNRKGGNSSSGGSAPNASLLVQ